MERNLAGRDLISEKEFSETVRRMATLFGWKVFCTWNSQNSPAGEPDLRLLRYPREIWAELKREDGKVTPDQEKALDLLTEYPSKEVYLWRPRDLDQIERILSQEAADVDRPDWRENRKPHSVKPNRPSGLPNGRGHCRQALQRGAEDKRIE